MTSFLTAKSVISSPSLAYCRGRNIQQKDYRRLNNSDNNRRSASPNLPTYTRRRRAPREQSPIPLSQDTIDPSDSMS